MLKTIISYSLINSSSIIALQYVIYCESPYSIFVTFTRWLTLDAITHFDHRIHNGYELCRIWTAAASTENSITSLEMVTMVSYTTCLLLLLLLLHIDQMVIIVISCMVHGSLNVQNCNGTHCKGFIQRNGHRSALPWIERNLSLSNLYQFYFLSHPQNCIYNE